MLGLGAIVLIAWIQLCTASVVVLTQELLQAKNELPNMEFKDVLVMEDLMIDAISNVQDYLALVGNEELEGEKKSLNSIRIRSVNLKTNVVFLGFPSSAITSLRENWFDSLLREDDMFVSSHTKNGLFPLPKTAVKHSIHLVQVSFHVIDEIRRRLLMHAINENSTSFDYNINAWELEDYLQSLADCISVDAPSGGGKQATVFILNLNFGDNTSRISNHKFVNGYNADQISTLAALDSVVTAAKAVVESAKRSSRVSVEVDEGSIALSKPLKDIEDQPTPSGEQDAAASDSGQVETRDAVKATRAWASSFGAETDAITQAQAGLEGRALRIFAAPTDSVLGSYKHALAAAVMRAARNASSSDRPCYNGMCSPAIWVGRRGVIFKDVQAHQVLPTHQFGFSAMTPAPRALNESEWLRLGQSWSALTKVDGATSHGAENVPGQSSVVAPLVSRDADLHADVVRGRQAIRRHLQLIESLLHQAPQCDANSEILREPLVALSGSVKSSKPPSGLKPAHTRHDIFKTLTRKVVTDFSVGRMEPFCAVLILQRELLEHTLFISLGLDGMQAALKTREDAEDMTEYSLELSALHLRGLYEALDASNVLFDTSQLHADKVSEEATVYLGYLGSFVLHVARYILAPPLIVHTDPRLQSASMMQKRLVSEHAGTEYAHLSLSQLGSDKKKGPKKKSSYSGGSLLEFVQKSGAYLAQPISDEAPKDEDEGEEVLGWGSHGAGTGASLAARARAQRLADLTTWASLLPVSHLAPTLDVVVYVVRAQTKYKAIAPAVGDDSGFDVWTLMNEATRLKLPGQKMSITLQEMDSSDEQGLGLALSKCKRVKITSASSSADPIGFASGNDVSSMQSVKTTYVDSLCLWSHIQRYDLDHLATAPVRISRGGISEAKAKQDGKTPVTQGRPSGATDPATAKARAEIVESIDHRTSTISQHIPIFVLSVSSTEPLFIDGNLQATSVGDAVIVIQNEQATLRSDLRCGEDVVTLNGRNPVGPALAAFGSTLGGMAPAHFGHRGAATVSSMEELVGDDALKCGDERGSRACEIDAYTSLHDWGHTGNTPAFTVAAFSVPAYSDFEIAAMHRGRILKAVSLCELAIAELFPSSDRTSSLLALLEKATVALDVSDWNSAARYSNAAQAELRRSITWLMQEGDAEIRSTTARAPSPPPHSNVSMIWGFLINTLWLVMQAVMLPGILGYVVSKIARATFKSFGRGNVFMTGRSGRGGLLGS